MNQYFTRLENCHYVPKPGSLKYTVRGLFWSLIGLWHGRKDWRDWRHGHGFEGWLNTSEADPRLALKDWAIVRILIKAIKQTLKGRQGKPLLSIITRLDPNDVRSNIDAREGLAFTPLAVSNGKRNGPRDFLLKTKEEFPDNLTIQLHALASKILFKDKRAIGVEILEGKHLYQADPEARKGNVSEPVKREVFASREVIVCAGAFNTPQLLKLSGVGPEKELKDFNIDVVVDLPGVGENLQDRYEVGVVAELRNRSRCWKGRLLLRHRMEGRRILTSRWGIGYRDLHDERRAAGRADAIVTKSERAGSLRLRSARILQRLRAWLL